MDKACVPSLLKGWAFGPRCGAGPEPRRAGACPPGASARAAGTLPACSPSSASSQPDLKGPLADPMIPGSAFLRIQPSRPSGPAGLGLPLAGRLVEQGSACPRMAHLESSRMLTPRFSAWWGWNFTKVRAHIQHCVAVAHSSVHHRAVLREFGDRWMNTVGRAASPVPGPSPTALPHLCLISPRPSVERQPAAGEDARPCLPSWLCHLLTSLRPAGSFSSLPQLPHLSGGGC